MLDYLFFYLNLNSNENKNVALANNWNKICLSN